MKKAVSKVRPELHIFSFGGRSLTASIVEQTTQRGIFKLKYAMRELGLDESRVLAVYGPGMAITNTEREREAGFEDGLKLFMADCLWPYLGPVCRYGMFYVGDAINLSQIKKRYKNLQKEGLLINSKRFPPGTDHGNHFLEIRELRNAKNEFGPGYYAFDQNSITHLALLIALGIVLPTDHWQKPHKIGHRANVIRAELLETIQENGSISWDSGIGLDLRRQLHRITYNKDLGWVAPQDLAILARKLDGEQTDPNGICNKKKNKQVFQSPKQLELPF